MKTLDLKFHVGLLALCLLSPGVAPAATIAWTNTSGGDWSVASNWKPNQVPGAGDSALITSNGTYTVAGDVDVTLVSLTLGGAIGTQTLASSGVLTLNGPSTVTTNGILGVSWALSGSGLLTVRGVFNWTDGGIDSLAKVSIATNATLNISGDATKQLFGVLTNAGTINWSGAGNLFVYNNDGSPYNGAIVNMAGGLFNIQNDQTLACACYGFEFFNNAGTVRKSAGTGTSSVNVPFNNTGTVDVQSGSLSFNGGGTSSGTFNAAGRTIIITSGYIFSPGSMMAAATNIWTGGAIVVNSLVTVPTLELAGATVNGSGALTVNVMNFRAGILNLANTVTGTMNWTDGTIDSLARMSIATNATLNISGDATLQLFGALTNAGTVNWSGAGNLFVYNNDGSPYNGAIVNMAGGLFNIQNDQTLACACYGFEFFNNAGTVRKSAGAGTSIITVPFNNTGTVDVQSGALSFGGGGTSSGTFNAVGRTIIITSGYIFSPGSVIAAATNIWTGGTIVINSTVTAPNLELAGATVNGSGALIVNVMNFSAGILNLRETVTGTMNWIDGAIDSLARVSIATNATLNISGDATLQLFGALTNSGTVNWSGAGNLFVYNNDGSPYNGAIVNQAGGLFNIQNDQTLACACYGFEFFNNAGTFRKSAGTGMSIITVPFNNTGTVDAQSGALSFDGSYTLTGGTLNFGINSLTSFGKINLAGNAALTGTLSANLNNGYVPVRGNSFAVLTYGSESGSFTSLNLPSRMAWQTNYGATVFTLSVMNVRPALAVQTNRTINELTTLMVTNTATDPDIPANTLTYTLLTSPGAASISTSGVITWVTTEADGPGTNVFTTRVADNGSPGLTATNTFTVIVNELNVAPVLTVPANQTINELTSYTNNATVTDADSPANPHTFALVSGPPGLAVSTNGAITWTPTEAQAPGTYVINISVTDTNPPAVNATSFSVTNSFTLTANEVNVAPVLTVPANTNINELATLTVASTATDSDLPTNALTFSLVSPLAGMAINATNGVFTWTPTEAQGPGTNLVSIRVMDDNPDAINAQQLSVTNSFTIVVNEVNIPPALPAQTNLTINELTTLTVTNTATDADVPANALTYTLLAAPGTATISTNGVITWVTTEANGPSTNTFTTRVTDNGSPSLSTTNTFRVVVNELNVAPSLMLPPNQTISELAFYTNNAAATDGDVPANAFTFALVSGPANLNVSTSGAITWTPAEDQGPSTNTVTIKVTDTNPQAINSTSLSVTQSYQIIVSEENAAPALVLPANEMVNELVPLNLTATATDSDRPTNTLTFALVSGPTNLTVSAAGAINWIPGEAQGPSTNTVTIKVTDNNPAAATNPQLSVTNSFQIVVNESNSPPALTVPPDTNIFTSAAYVATAVATDADIPLNPLTFALISPPAGMTINSADGTISWTPTEAQGPSTNVIRVSVTDTNLPAVNARQLSVTNSYTITVTRLCGLAITTHPVGRAAVPGSTVSFSVAATTTASQTNYQWQRNSSNLNGETNKTLTITNLQTSGFGTYRAIVNDSLCVVTSTPAILTLAVSPSFYNLSLSGTTLIVSFATEVGPAYIIETKQNLNDPDWTLVTTYSGDGSPKMFTSATQPLPQLFFRIRLE